MVFTSNFPIYLNSSYGQLQNSMQAFVYLENKLHLGFTARHSWSNQPSRECSNICMGQFGLHIFDFLLMHSSFTSCESSKFPIFGTILLPPPFFCTCFLNYTLCLNT